MLWAPILCQSLWVSLAARSPIGEHARLTATKISKDPIFLSRDSFSWSSAQLVSRSIGNGGLDFDPPTTRARHDKNKSIQQSGFVSPF